ncbi:MFS transporter [Candidatus Harpocratesius sp.]
MNKALSPLPEPNYSNNLTFQKSEEISISKNKKYRKKKKNKHEFYRFCTPDFDQMNNIVFWNSLGFFLYTFLLRFATNQLLNGSGTETGFVFAAQTFGGLLMTPVVGYLTDRISKKKLVFIGAVGRGISYIFLYFGLGFNNLILFGVGVFFLGLAVVYFWTPLNALISQKTFKTVRSTAFGKQAGMIGWGNLIGAIFTILYYYSMNLLIPNNAWLLFLPLVLFCAFNIFAGIRFYLRVNENVNFETYKKIYRNQEHIQNSSNFFSETNFAKKILNKNTEKSHVSESFITKPSLKLKTKHSFLLGMSVLLVTFMISAINQSLASPFLQIYITETFFASQDAYQVGFSIMLIYLPSEVLSQLFAPKMGELGDKINPKIAISIICGIGSLVTWLLINTYSIILFVFILLIDTSLAWANGLVLANLMSRISKSNRGKIFSARQWVSLFGAAIGPILGGFAWEYLNHYAPFIISIFVELSLIPLYLLAIKWLDPYMEEKL